MDYKPCKRAKSKRGRNIGNTFKTLLQNSNKQKGLLKNGKCKTCKTKVKKGERSKFHH